VSLKNWWHAFLQKIKPCKSILLDLIVQNRKLAKVYNWLVDESSEEFLQIMKKLMSIKIFR